ncbi:type IV pilin protein [Massilia sp. TS11]|uniref:type IV pilin protein n=1 Tax=Massilia sp. TS11 TaxID=2908003 RepID=UPI001ED9E413|nr:type IV pilin protein [Massilia sp. TS11]MCG2583817.1 prepilin-type N-terminal cleavage/methylation domain-containing protein [Massilia sp. TS11]
MDKQRQGRETMQGLTLVELMVALVIVAVLASIALPSYQNYALRGKLVEAFSALGAAQPNAEQYWASNHTYVGFDQVPANTANFQYSLSGASASAYTLTATGVGQLSGFVFTINQSGARATTGVPSGWTSNSSCWVDRKDGSCSQ